MLPFTKRPGRGGAEDNSGDVVVTKDSLATSSRPKTVPPPGATAAKKAKAKTVPPNSDRGATSERATTSDRAKRSVPPPGSSDRPRLFQPSISDEEMTTLMPSKSAERERLSARGAKSPPPAAGRPASVPPPGAATSMRGKALSVDDEGDEGRTQIRAPLAGRMLVPNSKISGSSDHDDDERTVGMVSSGLGAHPADAPEPTRAMLGAPANSPLASPRPAAGEPAPSVEIANFNSTPAPGQSRPMMPTQPHAMQAPHTMPQQQPMMRPQQQPAMAYAPTVQSHQSPMVAHLSGAYPQQHGMPAPAMSQPAHFAVPQMAPSEQRMDPPATVLTQNTSRGSRTMSWAAALMAVGVFVGLVAAVVAGGGSDGLADTSASFVDPSRPGKRVAAQPDPASTPAQPPVMAIPTAATQPGTPVAQNAGQTFAPVGAPGAPGAAPPPNGQSVFPQVGTAPAGMNPPDPTAVGMGNPIANTGTGAPGAAATGVQPATATIPPATAAQPAQPAQPTQPTAVAANDPPPAPKPVARAPRATPPRAPTPPPAVLAANDDDPPKPAAAPAPKPPKPAAAAKPAAAGKGGDDDELKKAADALSKAQLENSL